ncbi:MAG: 6-phospho-beta-glucosidase [Betaproteobacteria bacterium]
MKVTVLGGAGIRIPMFVQGIIDLSRDVPVDELVLMDVDEHRLNVIGFLVGEIVARSASPIKVSLSTDPSRALAGADFIVSAIRVGGLQGRVIDETVPLRYGVLGQETTGPGGFCMGLRTIPVVLKYVRMMCEVAPEAWFINFTNPSGMITQAAISYGGTDRVIGVCDSPSALFRRVAGLLEVDMSEAFFDYFGLNHLGWLRGVYVRGRELLKNLFARLRESGVCRRLRDLEEARLFGADVLESLGMIPNEYLYYYYCNRQAVANVKAAGETRAQFLLRTTSDLMKRLEEARVARDPARALEVYNRYIELRQQMYMKVETTAPVSGEAGSHDDATNDAGEALVPREDGGYGQIALELMRSIARNSTCVMVLNTRNMGAITGLGQSQVVEVPCLVDGNGPHALTVGTVPADSLGLMQVVGEYERLTIEAAVQGSYKTAWRALAAHPLVPSPKLARRILDEYLESHGETLAHIQKNP